MERTPKTITINPLQIAIIIFLAFTGSNLISLVTLGTLPIKKPANIQINKNIICSNAQLKVITQITTERKTPITIGNKVPKDFFNSFLKLFTELMMSSYTLKIKAMAAPETPGIAAPAPIPKPAKNLLNQLFFFMSLLIIPTTLTLIK